MLHLFSASNIAVSSIALFSLLVNVLIPIPAVTALSTPNVQAPRRADIDTVVKRDDHLYFIHCTGDDCKGNAADTGPIVERNEAKHRPVPFGWYCGGTDCPPKRDTKHRPPPPPGPMPPHLPNRPFADDTTTDRRDGIPPLRPYYEQVADAEERLVDPLGDPLSVAEAPAGHDATLDDRDAKEHPRPLPNHLSPPPCGISIDTNRRDASPPPRPECRRDADAERNLVDYPRELSSSAEVPSDAGTTLDEQVAKHHLPSGRPRPGPCGIKNPASPLYLACKREADTHHGLVNFARDSSSSTQSVLNLLTAVFAQETMGAINTTQQWMDTCSTFNFNSVGSIGLNSTLFKQTLCFSNGDPTKMSRMTLLSSIVTWSTTLWSLQALSAFSGDASLAKSACDSFNVNAANQALLNGTQAKSSLCSGRLDTGKSIEDLAHADLVRF